MRASSYSCDFCTQHCDIVIHDEGQVGMRGAWQQRVRPRVRLYHDEVPGWRGLTHHGKCHGKHTTRSPWVNTWRSRVYHPLGRIHTRSGSERNHGQQYTGHVVIHGWPTLPYSEIEGQNSRLDHLFHWDVQVAKLQLYCGQNQSHIFTLELAVPTYQVP